nr:hypothetical protein [Tanacetum cinerariifolium]
QLNAKDKTGLGYRDQLSESDSEVLPSVFDSRLSNGDDNPTNDRFKKDDGYHAFPPPLTGNYMPPLADLSFAGLDDSVYRPAANKAIASIPKGKPSVIKTSNISVEMPKFDSVRTSRIIIEDWVSDDEDTLVDSQVDSQTTVKSSFKKLEFTKARNEYVKSDKQADKPKMVTQNSKADRTNWNDKYKWTNPESTQARRTRGRVTGEDEPEMFGEDVIPRPSGAPRKSKSQRFSASSSATSDSSKNRLTEFFQEQIQLDREAKKE